MDEKLGIVVIILLFVIVVLTLYLYFNTNTAPKFNSVLLYSRPELVGQYIKNPDIKYSSMGWLASLPENLAADPIVLNVTSDWKGTGFAAFSGYPIGERYGIALIHPLSLSTGRYIEQSASLPTGRMYKLDIGVADIAGFFGYGDSSFGYVGNCSDVGVRAIITDNTKGVAYTVFDKVITVDTSTARWYDYSIDLGSRFSGDRVTVRVESYNVDEGCGSWNGEWAAVDYIDIV